MVAAAAAAVAAKGGDPFEWVAPGRLYIIDSHACRLRFDVQTAGAAWLSKYDLTSTVMTVAKTDPLYSDLKIGRCVFD